MRLVVLWVLPELNFDFQVGDVILSFCDPDVEVILQNKLSNYRIYLARDIGKKIHEDTASKYQALITNLSLLPLCNGQNLREILFNDVNQSSDWFFNPLSFRDCEASDVYKNILIVNIVVHVKQLLGIDRVVLYGEPAIISDFFDYNASDSAGYKLSFKAVFAILCKSIVHNGLLFLKSTFYFILFKVYYHRPRISTDLGRIALSAFYDWSFKLDKDYKIEDDKYFKDLRQDFKRKKINYSYLCWFEPNTIPNTSFNLIGLIKSINTDQDLILVNAELKFYDIIKSYLKSFTIYFNVFEILSCFNQKDNLKINNYSVVPLISMDLLSSLVSFEVFKYTLIQQAFSRYFKKDNSIKLFLCFLEHYPYTRALSLAAKGRFSIISMQHASYSRGKTFYYVDPIHEFIPSNIDGLVLPHPDKIIVMGESNKRLFQSVGYKDQDVLQFGSLRYKDKYEILNTHSKPLERNRFNVLLPLSIKESIHIDLIKAVYTAMKGFLNADIIIRNHPYHDISKNDWVGTHVSLKTIEISAVSLLEDLNRTDLIISSYSTVAEEGLLMGIPVIQWASLDFEGSPLFGDLRVSTVSNVVELREKIADIIKNYEQYRPSFNSINEIYADYFSPSHDSNELISNYILDSIQDNV